MDSYISYLEHHGILGQKWGVKNGPPYPLDANAHNSREKKAGWRKSLDKGSSSKSEETKRKESVSNAKKTKAAAKQSLSDAQLAYNLAKNRYNYNVDEKKKAAYKAALDKASRELDAAKKEYDTTVKDLNTAKETGEYNKEVREKQSLSERHRENLKRKYLNQGMSEEEANAAVEKRIKIEKALAITAGVTVAAVGTYVVVNKLGKEYCDGILKKGTTIQTIAATGDREFDRAFYTSYKGLDKTKYMGLYGQQLKMQGGDVYKYGLTVGKDIRVAPKNAAAKIFDELYKSDSAFRDSVNTIAESARTKAGYGNAKQWRAIASMASGEAKTRYDGFNITLALHGIGLDEAHQKFYDALKKAGYHAIYDINDMKYSGYNTNSPLIIFDPTTVAKSVVSKVSDVDFTSAAAKSQMLLLGREFLEGSGGMLAVDAAMIGGTIAASKNLEERLKELDRKVEEDKKKK